MSVKQQLKRALDTLDDAKRAMNRAKQNATSDIEYQIRTAIRELEDAESKITKAMRELPSE